MPLPADTILTGDANRRKSRQQRWLKQEKQATQSQRRQLPSCFNLLVNSFFMHNYLTQLIERAFSVSLVGRRNRIHIKLALRIRF